MAELRRPEIQSLPVRALSARASARRVRQLVLDNENAIEHAAFSDDLQSFKGEITKPAR
jgi:hypothetical protein